MPYKEDASISLHLLPRSIDQMVVCAKCTEEVTSGLVGDITLEDYARLEVGFTAYGMQVWCTRQERNVAHVNFESQVLNADFRCLEPKVS